MRFTAFLSIVIALLAACATSPEPAAPSPVSALKYKDLGCREISMEIRTIEEQAVGAYEEIRADRWEDKPALILPWPILISLAGQTPQAAELNLLRGEYVALQENSVDRECDIVFAMTDEMDAEELQRKIRNKRGNACPRRSTQVGYCRQQWDLEHPLESAILDAS